MNPELKKLVKNSAEVSSLLALLAHPTRLLILCTLMESERSVGELVEISGISQSLTSQFLIKMKNEGILESRRNGQSMLYKIRDRRVAQLITSLKKIFCS